VEQMAGFDAKFLYSETRTAHMHTVKLVVLDLSDLPQGYDFDFDGFVGLLAARLDRLPPFRRRVVPVPLGLGHPVWVEDPAFDIARHVVRRHLPPPAGDRELAALVAEVAGRPLPRDRPLWQVVVVEGLPRQRLAVVAKVHHALADGAATVALLQNIMDAPGTPGDAGRAPHPRWRPEPLPTRRELLALAARAHAARARTWPALVAQSVRGLRASGVRRRSLAIKPPLPFGAPRTSFNASLGSARTFAMTTLPLSDLKAIRAEQGATLNDVYLAVCAGAIRHYLLDRGELPHRPLVASVPVATDTDIVRLGGNHVDNLFVSIGTDIADPLARLHHIAAVTVGAKDVRSALGNDLLQRRAEVVPPQLYAMSVRVWERTRLANHLPPPLNLVLSNVPGPREPVRFGRAVIESLYSVGPILEGIGLNITAWSYVDALHVSVLASPTTVADPWRLADTLAGSLSELKSASKRDRDLAPSPGPL